MIDVLELFLERIVREIFEGNKEAVDFVKKVYIRFIEFFGIIFNVVGRFELVVNNF